MAKMAFQLPQAASVVRNPAADELQQLAAKMPTARWTKYENVNVQTEVLARSTPSTFIVTDDPDPGVSRPVSTEQAQEWADKQDAYIAGQEMILLDGWLGAQPEFRVPVRLYIEVANANIAGMQQQLWFAVEDPDDFEPELTVVYTPNLKAPGWPEDRLILVDLEQGVNRVFNSDYFGESKKGILRMWNKLVYDRGGIPLHAGAKVIPTGRRRARGHDRRPLRDGEDDDHLHPPERLPPDPGRLRRVDARRQGLRDRERVLREDLRAQPRGRANDLRRRHAAALLPGERLADRRRGRLLRRELHEERARDLPVRSDRVGRDTSDRRGPLPAHPEPERGHHPGSREARGAAGSGLFHAGGDDGHRRGRRCRGGQVPPRPRHEPLLPAPARPTRETAFWSCSPSTRSRSIS